MKKSDIALEIQRIVGEASAADAADLFLSPHISKELLYAATYEPGPAMWIVNRSDVFDETLSLLLEHPDRGIARRAGEKIKARFEPSALLPPPEEEADFNASEVPDFQVEEVLGHPRVPLESVMHFTYSLKDEHRASAALSATRRLLEYPPDWSRETLKRDRFSERFIQMLLNDPSPLVRSYASRFPMLDAGIIAQALVSESNATVKGRLLQHPKCPIESVSRVAENSAHAEEDALVEIILSLDSRLPRELRQQLLGPERSTQLPELAELCHLYQI